VVVSLQHADVANGAVVGARGAVTQAALAVRPIGVLGHAQRRQIADDTRPDHAVDVGEGVRVQEQRHGDVRERHEGRVDVVTVVVLHHVTRLVPESQLGTDHQHGERRPIVRRSREVRIAQKTSNSRPDHDDVCRLECSH